MNGGLALVTLLNGLSYGLLLFMLSSGLTLIFSMMGVLNFAHAAFYMLGAYLGWQLSGVLGFWGALAVAPLAVGLLGVALERTLLRRVYAHGHAAELLLTFGLSYILVEAMQLIWGRQPLTLVLPEALRGPALTLARDAAGHWHGWWGAAPPGACGAALLCAPLPATRALAAAVALAMLVALWALLTRTRIGLVIRAASTARGMTQALGHNVPAVLAGVFGAGCALAALAGVVGGATLVIEPGMAASVGAIVFVVIVVGGVGSLAGAFVASMAIGLLQTFAVASSATLAPLAQRLGWSAEAAASHPLWGLTLAQAAPMLPYLLLVATLALRPQGLLGARESWQR